MQLTRHTDYALRVLMYLGVDDKRLISVAEIAECYSISRNHLVKVVQGLTEHGFVITTRGKNGGMRLARKTNEISIGDVIRRMENRFDIVECFDNTADRCVISGACKLKGILHRALNSFLQELDGVSLADVLDPDVRLELDSFSIKP